MHTECKSNAKQCKRLTQVSHLNWKQPLSPHAPTPILTLTTNKNVSNIHRLLLPNNYIVGPSPVFCRAQFTFYLIHLAVISNTFEQPGPGVHAILTNRTMCPVHITTASRIPYGPVFRPFKLIQPASAWFLGSPLMSEVWQRSIYFTRTAKKKNEQTFFKKMSI